MTSITTAGSGSWAHLAGLSTLAASRAAASVADLQALDTQALAGVKDEAVKVKLHAGHPGGPLRTRQTDQHQLQTYTS